MKRWMGLKAEKVSTLQGLKLSTFYNRWRHD
jgi:hypothetical protein